MTDHIDRWLSVVSGLINPMFPGECMEALLRLRPHLREFPAVVFTADSARAVAEAKRFGPVPGWDVVAPILQETLRASRPDPYLHLGTYYREPDREAPDQNAIARVAAMAKKARLILAEGTLAMQLPKSRPLADVTLSPAQLAAARRHDG